MTTRYKRPRCTGLTARWCPRCGDCSCGPYPAELNSERCPLHRHGSDHAEDPTTPGQLSLPPLTDREAG